MNVSIRLAAARLALIATIALIGVGCDFGVVETTPPPEAKPVVQTIIIDPLVEPTTAPTILPAYETAAERASVGKRDAADDYRWDHKEWFAITEPPEEGRFRPFAEWEEMTGVWTTYSNGMPGTAPVRRMFAEQTIGFIRHSQPKVKAYVIVNSGNTQNDFLKAVDQYGITPQEKSHIVMVGLANQTIWHIDYGPFPLVDKKTGVVAFTDYNYYQPRMIDDAIPTRIAIGDVYPKKLTTYRMPFSFEGGNIQADGKRMCATTTRALSNTGYSPLKVRNLLRRWNACEETVIVKDITDDGTGHIDMFFKWSAEDEVMFGRYDDTITLDYDGDGKEETLDMPGKVASDYANTFNLNQQRMDDNAKLFASIKATNGKPFKVHRLAMMTRLRDNYGNLPRTFINSTFTNGVNMYPSYTTKSCRNPKGAKCMQDKECANQEFCAAGKCTPFSKNSQGQVTLSTPRGCDEIVTCGGGQECADDPLKIALTALAQKEWEAAMPEWKHVGLRADTIALWSGAIHCITRTVPKGKYEPAIDNATCIGGTCACVEGGAKNTCTANADCFGPTWMCDCRKCAGFCADGGKCTDDADCSLDGKTVVDGSCKIDPGQSCYGKGSADGCGGLAWEGTCNDKLINYCSKSGVPKKVKCSSSGCCGWSDSEASYTCLSSKLCGSCVAECAKAGDKGCSALGTHLWECVDEGGCLKRKWSHCGTGKTCDESGSVAACAGAGIDDPEKHCGNVPKPDAGGTDSGGADAGKEDAGPATDSGTAADSGPVNGDTQQDAGTAKPTPPPPKDDGCTAGPAGSGTAGGLLALLLAALGLVAWRRRMEA